MSPKASDIQWSRNTSMLLKSDPGLGKTIAALSAAIYGEVYLAYFDKNIPIEALTFFKKYRPDLLERITYDCFGSHNANDYLNKLIEFQTDCRYAAVISDGATFMTASAMNWSLGFNSKDPRAGAKVGPDPEDIMPDWDEYKVLTSYVTRALDLTRNLKTLNIWTAHPLAQIKVEGSGSKVDKITKTSSLVSAGSKIGSMIPGAFNEIYHIGKQAGVRKVWTDMVGEDFARTSLPLPKSFNIPEGGLFFEVWEDLVRKGFNDGGFNEVKPTDSSGSSKWKA